MILWFCENVPIIVWIHLGTAWANRPSSCHDCDCVQLYTSADLPSNPAHSFHMWAISYYSSCKEWSRILFHQRPHKHRAEWRSLPQIILYPKERNGSCKQRKQCRNTLKGHQPAWCEPGQCPSSVIVSWGCASTAWRENMQQDVNKLPLQKWCCPGWNVKGSKAEIKSECLKRQQLNDGGWHCWLFRGVSARNRREGKDKLAKVLKVKVKTKKKEEKLEKKWNTTDDEKQSVQQHFSSTPWSTGASGQ